MTQVLKELFPQCFDKNGDLMPHKLQEAILDLAQENNAQANTATQDLENEAAFSLSKESYSLNWLGKSYAKLLRHLPTHTLIAQDSTHNAHPKNANSKNVLIKGDNLEVLKHLKNAYYRKVKMICIDPPYNTGNGDFIYNDERSFTPQSLAQMANIEIEEANSILNLTLKNSSTHSAWLSFMYPRLYIARQLLRDDGVIFISIDDNEQANLKLLCDEIFGEENFVSCFVWQKKSGGGQAKYFYEGHEYVLIYCKNKDLLQGLFKIKEKGKIETDFLRKIHGKYTNNLKLKNVYEKYPNQLIEHRNLMFEEMDIFLQEKLITQEKYDEIKQNLTNGIYFLKPYNDKFNLVCRNNENNQALMYSIISGVWTSDGNTENEQLFGKLVFNDPKPVNLLKQLIQSATMQGNSSDIVLDFFAGSGTTAQAVMELNAEDKGNREFILVQLDEVIDKSKSKTAYEFCKNELGRENPTIFDITKERIKRASAKITQNSNLDLGFKIYELRENDFDSQNGALFKEVDKNALLESFRLQDSTPLSVENQTIDLGGYKAIRAGEKLYLLNSGFEMKHLQKLISLIDAQKDFVIKEISYLNDTFESARIREIEEGIKSYSNKKGLKILVRARFA